MTLPWSRPVPRLPTLMALCATTLFLTGCGATPEDRLAQARDAAATHDYRTASIHLKRLLQDDPGHVEALVLLADVALAANDPAVAERNYRQAVGLGAAPVRVRPGWTEALLQLGRYEEALASARAMPADSPAAEARRHLLTGRAQRGLGQDERAEASLQAAIRTDPQLTAARVELARFHAAAQAFDAADREIATALAIAPDDPDALLLQATRLLDGGRRDEARPVLEHALSSATQAGRPVAQVQALDLLGEVALSAGRLDEAESHAEALRALAGPTPTVRYLRARIALEHKDVNRARTELQEILAVERGHIPAQRLLGALYTLENQFDLAEMYLKPVVAARPDDFFARRLLAGVHLARNRPAEALPLLDRLEGGDPESRQALLMMSGQASLQLGDITRAVALFREGAKAFPDNPLFELGLGLTLLAEGRTDEAQRIFRQATGPQAEATRAAVLAIVYMQKGQPDHAVTSARALVEQHPDQSWSHNLLGSILLATGRFAEARPALARAVALAPEDTAALANLARVEQLLGERSAAVGTWQRILKADPDNADAALSLASLELDGGQRARALEILAPFEKKSTRVRLLTGAVLLEQGAGDQARRMALDVTREQPENAEAWNLLGLVALAGGQPKDAAAHFERARRERPEVALYLVNLARAHAAAGDERAAAEARAQARQLAPDLAQLHSLEFLHAIRAGDLTKAERILTRVGATAADDPGLQEAMEAELAMARGDHARAAERFAAAYAARPSVELAWRSWQSSRSAGQDAGPGLLEEWVRRNPDDLRGLKTLAGALLAAGRNSEAIRWYEEALRRGPQDLQVLNDLAWLYQEAGDPRALRMAAQAVQIAPQSPAVLDTAGWAQSRLGDKARGLALLREAAALAPDDGEIRYHLAMALDAVGQRDEARRMLVELLDSRRPFASRAAAQEQLGRM